MTRTLDHSRRPSTKAKRRRLGAVLAAMTIGAVFGPTFAARATDPAPDLAGTHLSGLARVTSADCNPEGVSTVAFTASGTAVAGAYDDWTFVETGTFTIGPLDVGTTGPAGEFATGLIQSVEAAFTITGPDGTVIEGTKTMDASAYPLTPTGTCTFFEAGDSPTWPYNAGEYHRGDSGVHYEATITDPSGRVGRQSGDSRLSVAYTQLCTGDRYRCAAGYGPFGQSFITTDEIADRDLDGVDDETDNCPDTANGDQRDADDDGIGDACDPTPNGENPPPTKEACKDSGWEAYTDDRGAPFRNQGDCVSFVATGGRNQAG